MKMPVRERLLDAAEALVNRRGVHATSTDAVIATADAARRSLYNHFGSKEALVAEMLERRDERFMRGFKADVLGSTPDPVGRLLALIPTLGRWFQQPNFNGCLFVTVIAEATSCDDPAVVIARRHKQQMMAFVQELACAATFDAPEVLARQLVLIMEGATVVAAMTPGGPAAADATSVATGLIQSWRPLAVQTLSLASPRYREGQK